ncbi:MAG: T9SS type A sorting domain-containing protein [Flavobacteriales bacterium]|jgi:hypothetical protein|nr:T9SS type A sorting domain-containing protein [Flavobacteriales bacterium]
MKKTLTLVLSIALAGAAHAQCTPDPLYTDSLFGVWPDTTTNFAGGTVGVLYAQSLDLKVPTDAGVVDPAYSFATIDSIALTDIDGLPPGLSVACASQTSAPCTFLAGQLGCGVISGVPTTAGTYELTINIMAHGNAFGTGLSLPYSFSGYRIVVAGEVGVSELGAAQHGEARNVPNPFSSRTTIEFALAEAGAAQVRVFTLVGEEVWSRPVDGRPGLNKVVFESGDLGDGVYLYKVEAAQGTFTGRMVLRR